MGNSRSLTPAGRGSASLLTMPASNVVTMHDRVNQAMAAAERNARTLDEHRTHVDSFKALRAEMQKTASSKGPLGNFSMASPLPPGTWLKTRDHVENLSFN